jgi:predicted RNA binding protein YcfA (HicA-like mRNA interferase family)
MSPRLPRDVSGPELAKLLEAYGYVATRQKGSHIRLTTHEGGEHHVTVPNHDPLRTGTLNGILKDVAEHVGTTRDLVVEKLFG